MEEVMETLSAQQELLQKLYTELDMEREATATAASESLSMILRLQGEKAVVEMEASQYKRIAEEKIVHTEEALESFRDLVYQKEMQIASLEFQVQAYRFKLISLGCNDVNDCNGVTGYTDVRSGCSLPPNLFKYREEQPANCKLAGESSVKLLLLPEMKDQDHGHVKSGDFSPYWDQIRRLDERVKALANSNDLSDSGNKLNEMFRSCSLHSQASSISFNDSLEGEATPRGVATPAKVHDIFEVPETTNGGEIAALPQSKEKGRLSPDEEIYPVTPVAVKAVISDETDKNSWDRRITMSPDIDNRFHKPIDGLAVEHLYLKRSDAVEFEVQQMNRRLNRLEDERIMGRKEITCEEDDEKLLLMKDIKDRLNSIEDEIKRWRPKKKPSPKKEVDLSSLAEAMLHFWL